VCACVDKINNKIGPPAPFSQIYSQSVQSRGRDVKLSELTSQPLHTLTTYSLFISEEHTVSFISFIGLYVRFSCERCTEDGIKRVVDQ